jgi:hypothetical protein
MKSTGAQFETVNVLENPLLRQGIKEYTNWPTIPQVTRTSYCTYLSVPYSIIPSHHTISFSFITLTYRPCPHHILCALHTFNAMKTLFPS